MASIDIVRYTESYYNQWEQFIDESINGTIFHRQKFLSYHPPERFEDHSLLFFEKGHLIAVFPGARILKDQKAVLKSHPGSSYGGFVFKSAFSLKKMFDLIHTLEEHAKFSGFQGIEMRPAPKIFWINFCDQFDFALLHNNFYREDEELSTFFNLSEFYYNPDLEQFLGQFPMKNRNKIRKGLKGELAFHHIEPGDNSNIERFYEILSEALQNKYNETPTHSADEIKNLMHLFPDDVRLFGVFHEKKLIAGLLILQINNRGWHIFYAIPDYNYKNFQPLNFGLAELLKKGTEEGQPVINYGVSTEQGGAIINWDLFKFKENFLGTGVLRHYWVKSLK